MLLAARLFLNLLWSLSAPRSPSHSNGGYENGRGEGKRRKKASENLGGDLPITKSIC